MQAAAGQKRDEGGVHLGTVVATHEEPVLPADALAAKVQLADVVVQRQATVVQEAAQRHLLVACVADRLRDGRLLEDPLGFGAAPGEEGVGDRSRPGLAYLALLLGGRADL